MVEDRKENGECDDRAEENPLPYLDIVAFVVEESASAQYDSEKEEQDGLSHSSVLDGPEDVGRKSVSDTGDGDFEYASFRHGRPDRSIACLAAQIHYRSAWVNKAKNQIHKFYRLHEHQYYKCPYQLVARSDQWYDDDSAYSVYEQDVTVIEHQIEYSEKHEQDHAPEEARTEVNALLCLIVVLDEEAQSEEHCEYRIHFSCEKEECAVEDFLIEACPEFVLW